MANLELRDRDSIFTSEGLLFRVFGYSHPPKRYLCDVEYASAKIFKSPDPRAPRTGGNQEFYKFYNDEGMKLVFQKFPQYKLFHRMLRKKVVAVNPEFAEVRKPEKRLIELLEAKPKDMLIDATHSVLNTLLKQSNLSVKHFGVFGSMLHNFHHPNFSDIDLVVYGKKENAKIRAVLESLYADNTSNFRNEFSNSQIMQGKIWRYLNLTVKEFLWHQRRKQIYALFNDTKSGRVTKAEFEPVKAWSEISSEYNPNRRILQKGWVKLKARIIDDTDAGFIPSTYVIEPLEVLYGPREAIEIVRVFSYMEEFRLQATRDETVYIEGNLEEVINSDESFYQIALTHCPRYYEQVLKVNGLNQDNAI